jgi:phosphodiesterase/alkaline phosphatase D-like protein
MLRMLRTMDLDAFVWNGDSHYESSPYTANGVTTVSLAASIANSADPALRRDHYRQFFRTPAVLDLLQSCATYLLHGDHEIWDSIQGANLLPSYNVRWPSGNFAQAQAAYAVAVQAIQANLIAPPLLCTDPGVDTVAGTAWPLYYRATIGPVELFLVDGYAQRTNNLAADTPSKTIYGETQKAWLAARVAASQASYQHLILPTTFGLVGGNTDTHAPRGTNPGFQHDALDLVWRLRDFPNVRFTSGDQHQGAVQYAAPGALDGRPGAQGRVGYPSVLAPCACPTGRDANDGWMTGYDTWVAHRQGGNADEAPRFDELAMRTAELVQVDGDLTTRSMLQTTAPRVWWWCRQKRGTREPLFAAGRPTLPWRP